MADYNPSNLVDSGYAKSIDEYLKSKGSPLAGQGIYFVAAGNKYNISPYLLVAIAGQETSFGKTGNAQGIHNPFGMGPGIKYPSWAVAIDSAAKNLATNPAYKDKNTVAAIASMWAPPGAGNDPNGLNNNWPAGVSKFLKEMGFKGNLATDDVKHFTKKDTPFIQTIPGVSTVTGAAGAVTDATSSIAGSIGSLTSALLDWHFWARLGMGIGGAALLFYGLVMLVGGKLPQKAVRDRLTRPSATDAVTS